MQQFKRKGTGTGGGHAIRNLSNPYIDEEVPIVGAMPKRQGKNFLVRTNIQQAGSVKRNKSGARLLTGRLL